MNFKKFGKRLSKINRLYDDVKDDAEISSMELDLLLSYLREAYEYATEDENGNSRKHTMPKRLSTEPAVVAAPEQAPEVNVIEQIAAEEISTTQAPAEVSPADVAAPVAAVPSDAANSEPTADTSETASTEVDDELAAIFNVEEKIDISDQLSMSPIKDLTKGLGINEKIFTITELFGGDAEIYSHIMTQINNMSDYSEARDYLLTGIAKDQNWGDADKIKKAAKFAKLVKRRFL